MKKKYLLLVACIFVMLSQMQLQAQTTEDFETETVGSETFTAGGYTFDSDNTGFDVDNFGGVNGAGAGASNQFMDNFNDLGQNTYTITRTAGPTTLFTMQSLRAYLSSEADADPPTNDGTLTITGRVGTTVVFTETFTNANTTFPTDFNAPSDNGFLIIDFSNLPTQGDKSNDNINNIEFTLGSAFQYIAIDNFEFDEEVLSTDPPEVQSITLVGSPSSTATTVDFLVTFNEDAFNVDASDFSTDLVGTTGAISSVSGSGTSYTVTVSGISGDGTVSIDLIAGNNISDAATGGNSPAPAFTNGDNFNASRCFIEDFEDFATNNPDNEFTSNGVNYTTSNVDFDITFFNNAGASGSYFLDNTDDEGTDKIYSITTPGPELFSVNSIDAYLSSVLDGATPTADGSLTIEGRLGGSTLYTIPINSGFETDTNINNGFTEIDFAGNSSTNIDELRVTLGGAFIYIAIDDFEHCPEILTTDPPMVQNITLVGNPPASSSSIDYMVVFNEDAINVSTDDFGLTTTGAATGTISSVSGSGNAYTVSITGIMNEGSIRLDLLPNTDIEDVDSNTPPPPFTNGEVFLASICNIETFETVAIDANTWTTNSIPFESSTAFNVSEFAGAGAGNSDRYLDNFTDQGTGKSYTIEVTSASMITMNKIAIYLSSELNGENPTDDGTLTILGNLGGVLQYTISKSNGFPTTLGSNAGFYTVDFSSEGGTDNSTTEIDELVITIGNDFEYIAVDNFEFCTDPPPTAVCRDITVQLDNTGSVSITPMQVDGGSSDNSGSVTLVSVTPSTFDCSMRGANLVTLVVEDNMGQQSMCTATVTVEDSSFMTAAFTAPVDLCVDAGTQTGLSGGTPPQGTSAGDTAVYSGPGVTDDGNGMTYSLDPAVAGVGTHTITYTYTSANMCSSIATDTIEVFALPTVAFTAPADLCIDAGVQAGLGGGTPVQGSVTGDMGVYSGAGVTDDGNGMTYSFDPAAAGAGTHILTYTYTDGNGCEAFASDTIEVFALPVISFTAPADLCVDAGNQTGLGAGTPTGGVYSGSGVADDGNGMTYSFDPATAGVGTHTLTYTYTDGNGCEAFASDDIEVFALPVISFVAPADGCIDGGVRLGMGQSTTPEGGVFSGPGVTDNGNGDSFTFDPATAGVGIHTLTYTFTDGNGCTDSATDFIEIFALPTVSFTALMDLCVDAGVQAGLGGGTPVQGSVAGDMGVYSGVGVTDDGNGMTYSFDPGAAGVGTHTITYDYTDENGCANSASDDVEVFALPAVTFTAPAPDVCVEDAVVTGLGGGMPTGGVYSGLGVTDDGNGMTFSFDPAASDPTGGDIPVTYTFTDGNGCTSSATDDIFVDPVCCELIVDCSNVVNTPLSCIDDLPAPDNSLPIITESCGTVIITETTSAPSANTGCPGDPITITRTYTIEDIDGAMMQCMQTFTIESTNAPTVTPQSATVSENLDANCELLIPNYAALASSTADCGMASITQSPVAGTMVTGVQDITITLTATDFCGRTAMADITLTTVDVTPPVFVSATPIPAMLDAMGTVTLGRQDADGLVLATDACNPNVGIRIQGNAAARTFTCADIGGSNFVQVRMRDNTPGVPGNNDSFVMVAVDVQDNITPVITCAADGTRDTNPGVCTYDITGTEFDATFTDNCGGTITNDFNNAASLAGASFPLGTTVVTWTVDDGNGQSDTCTTTITVEDNEAPMIMCTDFTRDTDPNVCQYTVVGSDFEPVFSDNCTTATISNDYNNADTLDGAVFPLGDTTVTWTVDDGNGQTATCTSTVTIEDNQAPIIGCPADVVVSTDPDSCLAMVQFSNPSVIENCGGFTITQTVGMPSGSLFSIGINNIGFSVEDDFGNVSTCSFTITVEDNTDPVAVCQDITVQLDDSGSVTISAADINNGSTDNCNIMTTAIDIDTFDCNDVGDNTVTLTVTDRGGNTSSCTATVTVEDVTAPVVVCQDITVQLGADGTVTLDATLLDGGSSDACGIDSFTASPAILDCSNIGSNTVTLTVTDVNGNSSTCEATVEVEDTIAPTLVCQPAVISLGPDGTATVDPTVFVDMSNPVDNCNTITYTIDVSMVDCDDVGTTIDVTIFADDGNGNFASCMTTMTVEDVTGPIFDASTLPQGPITRFINPATGIYRMENFRAGVIATDDCSLGLLPITLQQDPPAGTELGVGVYDVTITAVDDAGNMTDYLFELRVEPTLGTGDVNLSTLMLYPNPMKAKVILSNPNGLNLKDVSIFDLQGRLIQTIDLQDMTSEKLIDVSQLQAASYVFVITGESGTLTKTMIKE